MRLDLVGTVAPAAGRGRRGQPGGGPSPVDRLAIELRSLVPAWTVVVHTLDAELVPASSSGGTIDARQPIGLAGARALGTPLAELLGQRWQRDRPDLVHADCFVSGLAALRAARPLDIPVVVARRHGAADPWGRPVTPAADVDLRLALCADHLMARDEEDLARLHRHAVGQRVSWLPAALDQASLMVTRPGQRIPGRLASVLDACTVPVLGDVLAVVDPFWGHRELLLLVPVDDPAGIGPSTIDHRAGRAASPCWLPGRVAALLDPLLGAVSRATARGVRVLVAPAGDHARRLQLLRTSGVFVYTPDDPPSDRAVVEAMAAGCVVVSSGVGRLSGLVADGVTGIVTAGSGPDSLASALAAGSHPDVVDVLGGRAAATAAERYAWPAVAAAAVDVYKTVAGGR